MSQMTSSSVLHISESAGKGRGVFTRKPITAGTLIESAPVIVIPASERKAIDNTVLYSYYFSWGADSQEAAIALGLGSLCNHSYDPNARYIKNLESGTVDFVALRDIPAGAEVMVNYNGDPSSRKSLWFDVIEP